MPTALFGKARQLVAGEGSHLQRNAISAAAGQDMTRHQYDKENHNTPPSLGRIKGILAEGGPQPVLVQNSGRQVTLGSWRWRGGGCPRGGLVTANTLLITIDCFCSSPPRVSDECSNAASTSQPESPSAPTELIQQVDSVN